MAFIDGTVVNVALPAIEADLAASVALIAWIVNAYTLCLAALVLIGGALGDRFGRRGTFVIGIAIFAAASVWCGLAASAAQLVAARAVQGIGAALLIPCSLAIIGASFAEHERGRAIGTWAGFSAIAGAIGPVLGGFIVDHSTWRWIFLINPLIALPTIVIALRHVPESRDAEAPPGLDWPGAVLAFGGLGGVVFGLIASPDRGWRDPTVAIATGGGVILLMLFLWAQWRSRAPMMPLDLFRSRVFSGVNLLTLLLYSALAGAFFLLPFDLIQVHGFSALAAGGIFLPFTLIMAGLSRWSGGLIDKVGARAPLIAGPVIVALGFALLALPGAAAPYWAFLLPVATVGVGMAVAVAPLTTSVINAVPAHQAGVASGINNAVASVARLLAVALFGAIALGSFNRAIDQRLAAPLAPAVKQTIANARGKFVVEPAPATIAENDRRTADTIIRAALADSIRLSMLLAAALALGGALCAAVTMGPSRRKP